MKGFGIHNAGEHTIYRDKELRDLKIKRILENNSELYDENFKNTEELNDFLLEKGCEESDFLYAFDCFLEL